MRAVDELAPPCAAEGAAAGIRDLKRSGPADTQAGATLIRWSATAILTAQPDTPMKTRIERDTFGPVEVPDQRLWGAQTQRSLQNFAISGERQPLEIIRALTQIKRSAAVVNHLIGLLPQDKAGAIIAAADEVLAGQHDDEFPLVVWQTGSGTQTNMNVNEVLANRASELLGGQRGEGRLVHPNDDVNMSQSSNDVFPTAMSLAAAESLEKQVIPSVRALAS